MTSVDDNTPQALPGSVASVEEKKETVIPNEEHVRKLASCMMSLQGYRSDGSDVSDMSDSEVSEVSSDSEDDEDSDAGIGDIIGLYERDEFEEEDCGPLKSANEVLPEELPPVEKLSLSLKDGAELSFVGTIVSILDGLACIQSSPGLMPYDLDTVLWMGDRTPFGKIFDVFGQVACPFYVVRVSEKECKEMGISTGTKLYVAPQEEHLTSFVHTQALQKIKGSDASWKNDEEPPENVLDYSDDEEERMSKRKPKNKKKNKQTRGDKLTNTSFIMTNEKPVDAANCSKDIYGNDITVGPVSEGYTPLARPEPEAATRVEEVQERLNAKMEESEEEVEDIEDAEAVLQTAVKEEGTNDSSKMSMEGIDSNGNQEQTLDNVPTVEAATFFDEPPALH
eukprot:Nk52_evm35s1401 gene=Nk52_evmTU35s1401